MQPVFRFAPSPNGALHLGHALSALINYEAAKAMGGRFLLRMEDIDTVRCTHEKTTQMLDDLNWLGLKWEEPILYQSSRFEIYKQTLSRLKERGLVYPSQASRKQIQTAVRKWEQTNKTTWPRDPDGAPLYPRTLLEDCEAETSAAWRLDMQQTLETTNEPLFWQESGPMARSYPATSAVEANPAKWGDVILARKDTPTSYHLSVVMDDADQAVTHIVRGQDLYEATHLHRQLQVMLELPAPIYHHHRLLTDTMGDKLSKSRGDLSIKQLRADGVTPTDIRKLINWSDEDLRAFDRI